MNLAPLFRLAPTPSGYLHLGNGFSFVLTQRLAAAHGAKLLLRIDDIDADRKRPEYIADIFQTLDWLGISWDIGPQSPDDFEANWSQRLRLTQYHALLAALKDTGKLYACAKSRQAIAAAATDGQYPVAFRADALPLDTPETAWRIHTPAENPLFQVMRDFVVRRRDGIPAYQIASLADDIDFGVTHIVRGADLLPSTQAQVFLAELLGEKAFLTINFLHHPLKTDDKGIKLSKSEGATSLQHLRSRGESPKMVHDAVDAFLAEMPALAWQQGRAFCA